MYDIFGLLMSTFGGFYNFLDNFMVVEGLSFLKLLFIVILFYVAMYFLVDKKNNWIGGILWIFLYFFYIFSYLF